MELQLQHLCKQYGEKRAVNDVTATLSPGVYGLLGANGAGKSTLMRMICGVLKPTSGYIRLNGKTIEDLGERYYAQLGYMPQDFGFYPDFTAREFMRYMAAVKGIDKRKVKSRTEELLHMVNLTEAADKKVKSYSGGMKQRLGIAQAMLNEPEILILDEPTAGLDPKERVRFRNLISSFSKDKIVLLSTHIVSDVEYIADEILVMKDGRLIHRGAPEVVTQEAKGLVWECKVESKDAERYIEQYNVGNLKNVGDKTTLRIISDTCPCEGAVEAEPTLEDLYLYYFSEEGKRI